MIKFVPQPQIPYVAALMKMIEDLHTQDEHGERVWATLMDGGVTFQAASRTYMKCHVTQYGAVSVQLMFFDEVNSFKLDVKTTDLTATATTIIGFFTNEWSPSTKLPQYL